MSYYWVTAPQLADELCQDLGLSVEFDDQAAAEAWLTTAYLDLVDAGAHEVSLYDSERLVYGPMSLSE